MAACAPRVTALPGALDESCDLFAEHEEVWGEEGWVWEAEGVGLVDVCGAGHVHFWHPRAVVGAEWHIAWGLTS